MTGTLISSIVLLAILLFIFSLLLGKGKPFLERARKVAIPIVVIAVAAFLARGVWIPNAGGGLAINQGDEASLVGEDFSVNIQVGYDENSGPICEAFDHNLEYYLNRTSPNQYSKELAHYLISLCNSVGNKEWFENALGDMRFEVGDMDSNYDMGELSLAYCIDQKVLSNGTRIVLVAIRGSSEDPREWASNLSVVPNHDGQHSGFSGTADILYDKILDYGGGYDLSKTVYVITGHSRGAAVANIIAAKLIDQRVPQNHVFCYCFACPDTAFLSDNAAASYKTIFNIGNVNDIVSWSPWLVWRESGAMYGFGTDTHWNKYGTSYWFSGNNWVGCHAGLDNVLDFHLQDTYLNFLRERPGTEEFKNRYDAASFL